MYTFGRRVAMQTALKPLSQYRAIFQLSAGAGTGTPGGFPIGSETRNGSYLEFFFWIPEFWDLYQC